MKSMNSIDCTFPSRELNISRTRNEQSRRRHIANFQKKGHEAACELHSLNSRNDISLFITFLCLKSLGNGCYRNSSYSLV